MPASKPVHGAGGVATAEEADSSQLEADRRASAAALLAAPDVTATNMADYFRGWFRQVRSGESGVLPVVIGLIVIIIVFEAINSLFLSAGNIVNLLIQSVVYIMFGIGEVFVLLLGEIDLSMVYNAGIGGGAMAILLAPPYNLSWWLAVIIGLAISTGIGVINGILITRLRLPSFIVTLGGFIGFEGVMIWMFDHYPIAVGGVVEISNRVIVDLTAGYMTVTASWITLAACVVVFGSYILVRDERRRGNGLVVQPRGVSILKVVIPTIAGIVLVLICSVNRGIKGGNSEAGVPWAVPIVLVVLVVATFLLTRTKFGRYVYAIGGNAEAARRAGVNLYRIRTIAFGLSGLMAGVAGVLYASQLSSIATDIDSDYVLYAVAAAVIGGTSLFGGRGKPLHAVIGGVVIAAIANGLGLLSLGAAPADMVTALVLVGAITVDSLARRGQRQNR